jgi:hypothetical protein
VKEKNIGELVTLDMFFEQAKEFIDDQIQISIKEAEQLDPNNGELLVKILKVLYLLDNDDKLQKDIDTITKLLINNVNADFIYILGFSVSMLIVDFLYFFLLIFILNYLTPFYNIKAGKAKIAFLIYTCLLPFYFCIIVYNLFPALYFLNVIIVYSLFLFYWGLKNYLKVQSKDALIIFITFSLIMLGSYLILNFLFVRPFFDFTF